MKTKAFALLLAATTATLACQASRQTPGQPPPQPGGTGTASPNPNPNPEPPNPNPPATTPVAAVVPAAPANPAPVPPGAPAPPVAAAPAAAAASPMAAAVPDQHVIATDAAPPAPEVRPHETILKMKEAGASDAEILARVRTDNVNYHLTTSDLVELRGAGVSPTILEAMIRSGQR